MFGGPDKPKFGAPLVQPVIWDRVRNQSLEPGMGMTEGAKVYPGGANAAKFGEPADLGMGWQVHNVKTPSGLNVNFERSPDNHTEVSFHKQGTYNQHGLYSPGAAQPSDVKNPSPKQAINSLGEVFSQVKDYVAAFKPKSINFSAASDSLQKVYDKVAPVMAKQLGGTLDTTTDPGTYTIRFK